jgi:hypothetical protein
MLPAPSTLLTSLLLTFSSLFTSEDFSTTRRDVISGLLYVPFSMQPSFSYLSFDSVLRHLHVGVDPTVRFPAINGNLGRLPRG